MKIKIYVCVLCLLLVSCMTKEVIDHPISGKEVTLKRDALLYYVGENRMLFKSYPYDIYDKSNGNSWRKEGWLKNGEHLRIHEVASYLTDGRGDWIGVTGAYYDQANGKIKNFRYCWSLNGIKRAPWESLSIPEHRSKEEWLREF